MKTTPYKAVFVDLDGTLLNRKSQVSSRTLKCVQQLLAHKIHVIVATGRPIESIRQILADLKIPDPVISLSGSMVHKELFGEVLAKSVIPYETMHRLLEVCRGLKGVRNILLDDADGFYALHRNNELREFIGMYQKDPLRFDFDNLPQGPVLSILLHALEERREIYDILQEQFAELIHFTYFREYPWIEMSTFESNKGQSLRFVCSYLGIEPRQVMAFGDGANDLEMIAAAGMGVAMENGDDEIKAIADRIAPHHDEDGVAVVLEDEFGIS